MCKTDDKVKFFHNWQAWQKVILELSRQALMRGDEVFKGLSHQFCTRQIKSCTNPQCLNVSFAYSVRLSDTHISKEFGLAVRDFEVDKQLKEIDKGVP